MEKEQSASSLNGELNNIFNKALEFKVHNTNQGHFNVYQQGIRDLANYWTEEYKGSDIKSLSEISQEIKKAISIEQCQYSVNV